MSANPFATTPDLFRKNIDTQLVMLTAFYSRLLNASLQLGQLNTQAGRKLVEESTANLQRALQLRSPAEFQSFLGEQSTSSVEKVRGYMEHVQHIATNTWVPPHQDGTDSVPSGTADAPTASQAHAGQHEVDVQPSALVEKLVASVAVEPQTGG